MNPPARVRIRAVPPRRFLPVAVLAVFAVLFFWKITLSDEYSILCLQDWGIQFYPWYQFASFEIQRNHTLPLWDPFSFSGRNFVGEMQTGVFYPGNWFVYLGRLGEMLSVDWLHGWIVLSFVAGGWAMYRCARSAGLARAGSLIAGLSFVFGGSMSRSAASQVNIFHAWLWLPVVFLFFCRALRQSGARQQLKNALLAGAAWGMSFLAGHHEPGLYIGLAVAFWTALYLVRPCHAAGRTGACALLLGSALFAFLAAAVQLLPAFQYAKTAYRWAGDPIAPNENIPLARLESTDRVEPRSLFSLLFPGVDERGQSDIYFGVLPLLLAVYGVWRSGRPQAWRFAALAGFSLAYCLAGYAPLHGILVAASPLLRMARESIRMLAVFHFALAMLAGAGTDRLLARLGRRDRRVLGALCRLFGLFVGLAGFVLVALTLVAILHPDASIGRWQDRFSWLYYDWLMMAVALGLLRWRLRRTFASQALALCIAAAMLVDLGPANTTAIIPKSGADGRTNYYPPAIFRSPDLLQFVRTLQDEGRWDDETHVFPQNFQLIHRVRATLGYAATAPAPYMDYYWRRGRTREQLGVRYQFSRDAGGSTVLLERPDPIPRFQLTRNVRPLGDRSVEEWLQSADYRSDAVVLDPAEWYKLPDEVTLLARQPAEAPGGAQLLWENNRRIELETSAQLPAFLMTSERYDEGWSVYVDGAEAPVVRCNGVLRGVWVPAGDHRISFRYVPPGLIGGVTLSALYWLATFGVLYWMRRRPLAAHPDAGRAIPPRRGRPLP